MSLPGRQPMLALSPALACVQFWVYEMLWRISRILKWYGPFSSNCGASRPAIHCAGQKHPEARRHGRQGTKLWVGTQQSLGDSSSVTYNTDTERSSQARSLPPRVPVQPLPACPTCSALARW